MAAFPSMANAQQYVYVLNESRVFGFECAPAAARVYTSFITVYVIIAEFHRTGLQTFVSENGSIRRPRVNRKRPFARFVWRIQWGRKTPPPVWKTKRLGVERSCRQNPAHVARARRNRSQSPRPSAAETLLNIALIII